MKRAVLALLLILPLHAPLAQEPPMHSGALAHELDRVAHTGRVLYVAAHPDDENTRLLAYLANARHLTVGYLAMTRGGGGQNLIGTEQDELLGIIRTQELLAARRLDAAHQRFSTMRDFGYSKSAEETFRQWGHEEALADVVWVLRTFQPDVVLTRFDETPPNHGHHTASAILAREAVLAAADPQRFPEQLTRGASLWKVDRLLHNVSPWRGKPPADALALDVGGYDARLGLSYGELAGLSRTQHKSQGFGNAGERGPLLEHFTAISGTRPQKELLEGLELGWRRYGAVADPLIAALTEAQKTLTRDAPEQALPALLKAHRALEAIPEGPRKREARASLEEVILGAAGLFVRTTAEAGAVAPGEKLMLRTELVLRRPATVKVNRVGGLKPQAPLSLHEKKELSQELTIAKDAEVSTPYWLRATASRGRHQVGDPSQVGEPEGPPPLVTEVELAFGDRLIRRNVPVQFVWTDPVHGERARPVVIAPPATVTPARESVMVRGKTAVALRVRGWSGKFEGRVRLPVPKGWKVSPAEQPVSLAKVGEELTVQFEVTAPAGAEAITLAPEVVAAGKPWSVRVDTIDYPHIPMQVVLQPSTLKLVPLSIRIPRALVGYIEGPGDTVREDLAHVGVKVEAIDDATLRAGDLSRYAAILVGIRAYNTRESLRAAQPRLMRYVEQGGNLVVQYNTNSRVAPLSTEIGPYPLTLGRDRVTDETAKLNSVKPSHAVLTTPNRLGEADFEGWVQERGLYFAEKWDPRYEPVFSVADPGEPPALGSTLVARHGKGRYVYTGLSFFRQLPAGVPGAYRLLVNLMGVK